MAYQSLYRRYRPQRFGELRGQEHLVVALRNAVRDARVGDAYLFSGPRGTGKTSTARILAKALNCENVTDGEPCGVCESCKAIELGTSFDVFELDAASNNGVDAIRELVAKAALGTPGRTKVYILDEVHMLSTAASNALLKTLEEPPPHVVFVLATTDPQKVLPTIRSRTQHFEVHLLPASELEALVRGVIDDADLDVADDAVDYVVRVGAGSARDTLSALDRVVAAGHVPRGAEALDELVEALCDRDTGRALRAAEEATSTGHSPRVLGEQLIARLRDVFLASVGTPLERLSDRDRERVQDQAERLGAAGATRALEGIGDAFVRIHDAADQRTVLDVALVRLTRPELDTSPAGLLERVTRLERQLRSGGVVSPGGAGSTPGPEHQPDSQSDDRSRDVIVESRGAVDGGLDSRVDSAADFAVGVPIEDPAGPSAGQRVGSAGPAADARRVLAEKRASSTSKTREAKITRPSGSGTNAKTTGEVPMGAASKGGSPTGGSPTGGSPTGGSESMDRPGPTTRESAGALSGEPSGDQHGDVPTRDELTLAWGDVILPKLGRAKPRYAGGRWVSTDDGVAVFALPNKIHAAKCEEVRPDVEAVLARHFGRPVPIRITVDTGSSSSGPGERGSDGSTTSPEPVEDDDLEDVDVAELADAEGVAISGIDRIAEVFPGAEVVE